jgi:hypothetical protein
MSIPYQYKKLLEKVAHKSSKMQVSTAFRFCMGKTAGVADNLLWAAGGALPAYLVGQSLAKEKEQAKHKNYALAGAAAGFLAPKLLGALVDPSSAIPSASGFDAQDITNLQLEAIS